MHDPLRNRFGTTTSKTAAAMNAVRLVVPQALAATPTARRVAELPVAVLLAAAELVLGRCSEVVAVFAAGLLAVSACDVVLAGLP